jgi:hypothetical protein
VRDDLKLLMEHAGPEMALSVFAGGRLVERVRDAKLDPEDFDLNQHLQLVAIADKVIEDALAEGFESCTHEFVYLLWLTLKTFHPGSGV